MNIIRQVILAVSSIVASSIIWVVILLGTIALSVGFNSPISIPFVINNEIADGDAMTNSSVEFIGLFIAVTILAIVIFMISRWLDSKRQGSHGHRPDAARPQRSGE